MDMLEESGLATMVGKVNMDRNGAPELQEKSARLIELDAALNMEAGPAAEAICEEEPAEPAEKPFIQARLSKTEEERETAPSSPKQHRNEEIR